MSHVFAVDWDAREARYVLANVSRSGVRVEELGEFALPPAAEDREPADQAFAAHVSEILKRYKAQRARVLVVLPRSSVELLYLTLPPAKDEELSDLVANLALQESPTLTDDTALDFVTAAGDPASPRPVLVAALLPEEHARVTARCAAAGLKPQRLLLRPLASASLFRHMVTAAEETCLVVNRVGQEVLLNVVAAGRLGFLRTVRLPEQLPDEDVADRILAEINRTLVAAPREQIGDEAIRRVHVLGALMENEDLAARIRENLSLDVEVLDPLDAVQAPESLIPLDRERFAPLLGALLDEATGKHPLDFLHPHRPARPVARWRLAAMAAGVVAVVALALGLFVWGSLSDVTDENRQLSLRLAELNATAKKAVKQKERIEAIAAWRNREVNWLEELRDLSVRFPGARDAVVLRMSLRPTTGSGGLIDLQGLVRDPKIVVNMEGQIRDGFRTVRSRRVQQRTLENDYTWLYETSVSVRPRRPEQYAGGERSAEKEKPQPAANRGETRPRASSPAGPSGGTTP